MRAVAARVDFTYGNTRLRGRRPALLGADRLAQLTGRDLPALVAELRGTVWGRHVDPASADLRSEAVAAVEEMRRVLLRGVSGLYRDEAAVVVSPLLARYDLADCLTLLRGAAHDLPDEEVLAALYGVGRVDLTTARHVVADDPEAVVHRLAAARLPDPVTAAALVASWDRYLLRGDLAELEVTVAGTAMARWDDQLAEAGPAARPVRQLLTAERDAANLLAALRLRAGRVDRATASPVFLPPGEITHRTLRAVADGEPVGRMVPATWRAAVGRAAEHGDLAALGRELERLRLRETVAGFRSGDPLGADIPVAYVTGVDFEAHALRRLCMHAPPDATTAQLSVATA